ncbi:MAG: YihY/virulence factor BrkB family protein [Bacteroidales bacterium]
MNVNTDQQEKFKFRHLPKLLKDTAILWNQDNPWRLSAVVAYYAVLSLPGLLVVIINVVGYFWGAAVAEGEVYSEIRNIMGASAADSMRAIFDNARGGESSLIATIVGIGALIFGATGVFYHLQISINEVWEITSVPKQEFLRYLIDRARGFGFVLVIGFLLLISFVISAVLSALQGYIEEFLPQISFILLQIGDIIISLGVVTLLFALIYKYLPDVSIGWRSVWVGALITSVLFALGKEILSYYFSEASPGSTYGAAGSIIIILLWVSYSCLILFFGAEFTWVYARRYGHKIQPKSHARYLKKGESNVAPGKGEKEKEKEKQKG